MKESRKKSEREDVLRGALEFIREGWFLILLPTIAVAIILLLLLLFADPYQRGMLHAKFILLYSMVGG